MALLVLEYFELFAHTNYSPPFNCSGGSKKKGVGCPPDIGYLMVVGGGNKLKLADISKTSLN